MIEGIEERVKADREIIEQVLDKLKVSSTVAYILMAEDPYSLTIRHLRSLQSEEAEKMLAAVMKHQMYFEARVREEIDKK